MIAEVFISVLAGFAGWVFDFFPQAPEGNDAVSGVSLGIATVLGYAFGFGHWIPWSVVAPVIVVLMGSLLAAGGIKAIRILASFVTLGGGSAA